MNNNFLNQGSQGPDMKRLILSIALITCVLAFFGNSFLSFDRGDGAKAKKKESFSSSGNFVVENFSLRPDNLETESNSSIVLKKFNLSIDNVSLNKDVFSGPIGYSVSLTNQGGKISDIVFNGNKKSTPLLNSNKSVGFLAIKSRGGDFLLNENSIYEVVHEDEKSITFQFTSSDKISVVRKFRFNSDQFSMSHSVEIFNNSNIEKSIDLDFLLSSNCKKATSKNFLSSNDDGVKVILAHHDETERLDEGKLNEPYFFKENVSYVGFDERYFVLALVPEDSAKVMDCVSYLTGDKGSFILSLRQNRVKLAPSSKHAWNYSIYAGPKQIDLLSKFGHDLENSIQFGWFGAISRPLLWALVKINSLVGNFGLAIAIITFLIKLITFPLTQSSFVSMQKMKKLSPDLKNLQKKYSHDKVSLGQKQMQLYRENGINPMAGCLPMFIQMPIWIALYQMLLNSVELFQQPFYFWVVDLTKADPYYIIPVVMGISMLVQTFFQPTPEDQPHMRYIMLGMPLFLTFIMLNMPSGLSLYIFTNNILTIAQQFYIKKKYAS